jgi:hypothetical protein
VTYGYVTHHLVFPEDLIDAFTDRASAASIGFSGMLRSPPGETSGGGEEAPNPEMRNFQKKVALMRTPHKHYYISGTISKKD